MSLIIKEMVASERPRERLLKYGATSLSNAEILSIVLKTGHKNSNCIDVANNLLKNINGLTNLKDINKEMLIKQL